MTANAALALPRRRAFTQADGRVDFRKCLDVARSFRRIMERSHGYMLRTKLGLTRADLREIGVRVRELVEHENEAWESTSATLRAAATHFDALVPEHGCDVTRENTILAIAAGQPAMWDLTSPRAISHEASLAAYCGAFDRAALGTVFEGLVSHYDERRLTCLTPLNDAGAQFLRNARAARAMRGRPVAA